ncbi:hypothetical protein OAA15_00775 [bacterium]|nr:hypothetical protein [bacterium]
MIPLSVQDQFDGSSKVADLKGAIGKQESFWKSSTGWAELVSVKGDTCYWKEIDNKWSTKFMYEQYANKASDITHSEPSYISWNKLFF